MAGSEEVHDYFRRVRERVNAGPWGDPRVIPLTVAEIYGVLLGAPREARRDHSYAHLCDGVIQVLAGFDVGAEAYLRMWAANLGAPPQPYE